MVNIVDPRLSQWDVGRSVTVSGTNATHVHFANQGDSKAVVVEIKNGTAEIPDFLLQTGKTLIAYCVLHKADTSRVTLESKSFPVRKRERPQDYVYEKSQRDYIYELITDAQRATEAANQATQNANEAADKANQAAKSWVINGEVKGESMVIDDAIDQTFAGFRIFGKTTQDGVPTPDAPVEMVSVENPTVAVNEQSMLVPYTLRGIPVASGGNYTDANGQQWVSDEVDFARGVLVQRCFKETLAFKYQDDLDRYSAIVSHQANVNCADGLGIPLVCDTYAFNPNAGYGVLVEGVLVVEDGIRIAVGSPLYVIARYKGEPIGSATVVYPIAIPIETPLSGEELAAYAALHTSRYGTTVSNDQDAYMDIHYQMDAKKYIDSIVGTGGSSGLVNATVE